jgi:hypothetical protein
MTPAVEPCRKFTLEGPLGIDDVTASVWLHDKRLDTEIISQHARSTYETPGGDCRQCGVVRITVEFFES